MYYNSSFCFICSDHAQSVIFIRLKCCLRVVKLLIDFAGLATSSELQILLYVVYVAELAAIDVKGFD